MISITQLTELLGWASLFNILYLLLATSVTIFKREWLTSIHSKLFGLSATELNPKYFEFLSIYKIITLGFFIAPFIALKIMGY